MTVPRVMRRTSFSSSESDRGLASDRPAQARVKERLGARSVHRSETATLGYDAGEASSLPADRHCADSFSDPD
jgi:hypothetical protein